MGIDHPSNNRNKSFDWYRSLLLQKAFTCVFSFILNGNSQEEYNCLHSADEETAPHMLADIVLGILTPSLGLLPLYDVSLLFLLNIHSNAAALPLAGNKQCT